MTRKPPAAKRRPRAGAIDPMVLQDLVCANHIRVDQGLLARSPSPAVTTVDDDIMEFDLDSTIPA